MRHLPHPTWNRDKEATAICNKISSYICIIWLPLKQSSFLRGGWGSCHTHNINSIVVVTLKWMTSKDPIVVEARIEKAESKFG